MKRHLAYRLLIWVAAVAAPLGFSLPLDASTLDSGTEILGLRMGMTLEAVKEEFVKRGIAVTEIDAETFSVPRPPTPLAGVTETRLTFDGAKLKKIVVLFAIPPPQPTAANLVDRFNEEKSRLTKFFGPPFQDVLEMKSPNPSDRYEWLVRGRAYYRSSWITPHKLTITLWLYGEDAGIVFMEIYEAL